MRSLWLTVVVLSLLGSSLATGQEPDAATVLAQAREAWQQESFADAVRLYRDLRDRFVPGPNLDREGFTAGGVEAECVGTIGLFPGEEDQHNRPAERRRVSRDPWFSHT